MAFSASALVLTPSGYRPANELKLGDELLTPLGVTKITDLSDMEDPNTHKLDWGARVGNFKAYGVQRFLLPDLTWGVIRNASALAHQEKVGLFSDPHGTWTSGDNPSQVYHLTMDSCPVVQEEMDRGSPQFVPYCRIETQNHLVVVDGCITEGWKLPSWKGTPDPMLERPLQQLTKAQLDAFKATL
jgi:hypothetical protein